jgi:hypothetical protein
MRATRFTAPLLALAAAGALALAAGAPAGASGVQSCATTGASACYTDLATQALAGRIVAGNNGEAFNNVRGTFHPAVGSTSNAAVTLQTSLTTGGFTAEEAMVLGGGTCPADEWAVEGGLGTTTAPGPLALVSLHQLPGSFCVAAGGSFYLDLYYSTLRRQIDFRGGLAEFTNTNVLESDFVGLRVFRDPSVGVHYTAALPTVDQSQFCFTRDGLTKLNHPLLRAGSTNSRLNLASVNANDVQALVTADGPPDHPTAGDPVFLRASAGYGTGGSFCVAATG